MLNKTLNTNIDAKREWQTYYPPELVGEYLKEWYETQPFGLGEIIEMKPGSILPTPPMPSLEGFLQWSYQHTAILPPQKRTRKGKGTDVR